jgi:hypothetical protein
MDLSRNGGWTGHGQVLLRSSRHHLIPMDVAKILYELERAWEAGSLPGRQSCEHNAALREFHRLLDRIRPRERQPLRLVTDR